MGLNLGHKQGRRELHGDIACREDGNGRVVSDARHVGVLLQAVEARLRDRVSVQVVEDVNCHNEWEEPNVYALDEAFLRLLREDGVVRAICRHDALLHGLLSLDCFNHGHLRLVHWSLLV